MRQCTTLWSFGRYTGEEMQATMKKMETGHFTTINEKIYRLYVVRVTWEDGRTRVFPSEEHAKAHLEGREPKFVPFKTP